MSAAVPTPTLTPPSRVASVDAYRGLVMFLMMAEVLKLAAMKKAFPDSPVWDFLAHHQTHAEWRGCSLHDLIQPSFSFLVGVALPFSLVSRQNRGESAWKSWLHAILRAIILIALGVFLRSVGKNFASVHDLGFDGRNWSARALSPIVAASSSRPMA